MALSITSQADAKLALEVDVSSFASSCFALDAKLRRADAGNSMRAGHRSACASARRIDLLVCLCAHAARGGGGAEPAAAVDGIAQRRAPCFAKPLCM